MNNGPVLGQCPCVTPDAKRGILLRVDTAHDRTGEGMSVSTQARGNHACCVRVRHEARIEPEHSGKMALMHDGGVVEIVDDKDVACELGLQRYGDGNFSLERIGASPYSFGVLACAFQ